MAAGERWRWIEAKSDDKGKRKEREERGGEKEERENEIFLMDFLIR